MIYQATYSGVPVYEYPTKNVAVMRRQQDGWVNATHILKVANFEKGQRTKILEKEVQVGVHEKIQGGYGKYQGTWVPLERARELAEQFNITNVLAPLFDYNSEEQDPLPTAPRHSLKPKASRTASLNTSTAPPPTKRARKATSIAMEKKAEERNAEAAAATPSVASDGKPKKKRGRPPNAARKPPSDNSASLIASLEEEEPASYSVDSASVSSRSSSPSEFMSDADIDAALSNGYPALRNAISKRQNGGERYHNDETEGRYRLEMDERLTKEEFSNRLLDYFVAPDEEKLPQFIDSLPSWFNINEPLDDEGNSAFHWACAMGDLKVINKFIEQGADVNAVNNAGHTPLVRAITYTNNYDRRTFPQILEILRNSIFYVDGNGQTILHHIALTTSSRSKLPSTRYYTEMLLGKVSETQPAHVIAMFVNRADDNGDTALHIASRNGAKKCVKALFSYGASASILNKNGRTAQEYIYEYEAQRQQFLQQRGGAGVAEMMKSSSSPIQIPGNSYMNGYGHVGLNNGMDHHPQQQQQLVPQGAYNANGNIPVVPHDGGSLHISEAAIQIAQKIGPIIGDYLEELAGEYDNELKDKNADAEQVRKLLETTRQDIITTEQAIEETQSRLGDERQASIRMQQANELVKTRAMQLRKLVERTQSRDLAGLVQTEELRVNDIIQQQVQMLPADINENKAIAQELSKLQEERKKMVDDIIELCANAGVGEKMNDYRRLIAQSCQVSVDDVDELLDGIAEALSESPGGVINEG